MPEYDPTEILALLVSRNEVSFTAFAWHPDVPNHISNDFMAIFNLAHGILQGNPVTCAMAISSVDIEI